MASSSVSSLASMMDDCVIEVAVAAPPAAAPTVLTVLRRLADLALRYENWGTLLELEGEGEAAVANVEGCVKELTALAACAREGNNSAVAAELAQAVCRQLPLYAYLLDSYCCNVGALQCMWGQLAAACAAVPHAVAIARLHEVGVLVRLCDGCPDGTLRPLVCDAAAGLPCAMVGADDLEANTTTRCMHLLATQLRHLVGAVAAGEVHEAIETGGVLALELRAKPAAAAEALQQLQVAHATRLRYCLVLQWMRDEIGVGPGAGTDVRASLRALQTECKSWHWLVARALAAEGWAWHVRHATIGEPFDTLRCYERAVDTARRALPAGHAFMAGARVSAGRLALDVVLLPMRVFGTRVCTHETAQLLATLEAAATALVAAAGTFAGHNAARVYLWARAACALKHCVTGHEQVAGGACEAGRRCCVAWLACVRAQLVSKTGDTDHQRLKWEQDDATKYLAQLDRFLGTAAVMADV